MTENPNTIHGRLMEAVHISGYGFERACAELEWLLKEDRWKELGFKDGAAFTESIAGLFKPFRMSIEDRKEISRRLTAIASQRDTAKVLGVDESTVREDLGKRTAGNPAQTKEKPNEINGGESDTAGNPAPEPHWTSDTDSNPAKAAKGQVEKVARTKAKEEANENLALQPVIFPEGKFGTIVIDPPWQMKKIPRDVAPNQVDFDYPTMDEEELLEFGKQVNPCAFDDCHMFMWTTQKHLPLAINIVGDWGWKYVLTMVWHKPGGFQPFDLPQYNCEFIIYARKGSPKFIDTKAFNVCFEAPRREHSRKPDEFYDLIERVTGDGRIDIFSREKRNGFSQFGNEADKFNE